MFRIAAGNFLGDQHPVALNLIDIPPAMPALQGTAMELEDCAFPLLRDVVQTADLETGFADVDYVFLFGARPRGKGMERSDLLEANGKIFQGQGAAINRVASREVRVLVIGNPANTNALIAQHHAPDLDPSQFAAMSRLDHDRSCGQISLQANCPVSDISRVIVWGNHSPSMYPDINYCMVAGTPAREILDKDWYEGVFIPLIQQRGSQVIEARGASSAASAANAAISHMRSWALGTSKNDWTSMSVRSDGQYGIEEGLFFSVPCSCNDGVYEVVASLEFDDFGRAQVEKNIQELCAERDMVRPLLK